MSFRDSEGEAVLAGMEKAARSEGGALPNVEVAEEMYTTPTSPDEQRHAELMATYEAMQAKASEYAQAGKQDLADLANKAMVHAKNELEKLHKHQA